MAHLKIADPEPPPFRVEEDGTVRVGKTRVTLDIMAITQCLSREEPHLRMVNLHS